MPISNNKVSKIEKAIRYVNNYLYYTKVYCNACENTQVELVSVVFKDECITVRDSTDKSCILFREEQLQSMLRRDITRTILGKFLLRFEITLDHCYYTNWEN